MTTRQKILKAAYPVIMWFSNPGKKGNLANDTARAPVSFYSLQATANDGSLFELSKLKGKKVLIVNTASDCGYTGQYEELEKLYSQYRGTLEIIAFPANDFKDQEKGNNESIARFCKMNYGISFPVMAKSNVVAAPEQNQVFRWLTDPAANGWNKQAPQWNFSKYLVNENGQLTNYFATAVSPLSDQLKAAIEK